MYKRQKENYLECFKEFAADVRRALKQPAFPIVTAQINRVINHPEGAPTNAAWDLLREAQRQAARTIPGVSVISTLDCGLSDCIHNHSAANLVIGERLAALALGQVYGHEIKCLHPDLKWAKRVNKRAIDLVFANVDERLAFEVIAPSCLPFTVRDLAGTVPLVRVKLPRRDIIRLELGRDLDGQATVTGAPGTNPPFVVPFDICGHRPMLAFTARVR